MSCSTRTSSPTTPPPRPGDVAESLADISLARELIGYEPSVAFEDGLQRTIDWIVEQSPAREAQSL